MSKLVLSKISPDYTGSFKSKEEAQGKTKALQKKMYDLLYLMFAHNKHSLLIILHGIDASGKDGTIRHLFESVNPQGIRVHSFKQPNEEELRHDFLWRCHRHTPESGLAAIFNRSYYEDVTTVMVHPEFLQQQHLPNEIIKSKDFFKNRYENINDFEKMLSQKGTLVLKFFLHISKEEQKRRLRDRLKDSSKNWKFSEGDLQERKLWDKYQKVFNKMLKNTDTSQAPWHVIPADHKWYRDYLVSEILVEKLEKLKMSFPKSKMKVTAIK